MLYHVIATRLRYASDGQWERSDCVRRSLKGEGGRGNPLVYIKVQRDCHVAHCVRSSQ